jgi:hypothetical protein
MAHYWLWSAGLFGVVLLAGYFPQEGMGAGAPALTLWLEVPAGGRVGEPVPLKVKVQNTSNGPTEVTFGGRPAYDFAVTKPDGLEVWRWSHGQGIQAILELKTLKPGETVEFVAEWEQRDNEGQPVPAGTYWVRGVVHLEPPERLETAPKSLRISP